MIVNKAYSGKNFVYRAYYNGQLIWDYGTYGYGDAFATLKASIMPYLENPDSAQMYTKAIMDGFGTATVSDFEAILAHTNMVSKDKAIPHNATAIHGYGTESVTVQATVAPFTFDVVYTYGDAIAELSVYGCPNDATAVHSFGAANVDVIDLLCPTVADVLQILASSKTSIGDVVMSKIQTPEQIVADLSSNFVQNCSPTTLPVYTVTFVNNGIEVHQAKIVSGYDYYDPVVNGDIEIPTKKMTAQYTYEFSGWSLTDGGDIIDESSFVNITDNIVLYAVYTSTVRSYTVTYYDDDGVTILKTQSVAYGSMPPSYSPTKSNYIFDSWSPEVAIVTGDISYYATWEEKVSFATASWEKIAEISESGNATKHFALGNSKDIVLSNGTVITLQIIGFNHDNLADGTGKAGITLLSKYVLTGSAFSNVHTYNSVVNWSNCKMRTYLNSTFEGLLPEDFKSVVKAVTKVTTITGNRKTTTHTTNDKYWLLSTTEVGYKSMGYGGTADGTRYAMFNAATSYNKLDYDLVKTNRDGTACYYFLRTPYNGTAMYYVNTIGKERYQSYYGQMHYTEAYNSNHENNNYGTVFGCCV